MNGSSHRKIARLIINVLFGIFFFLTLVSIIFNEMWTNADKYKKHIFIDQYENTVISDVNKTVENEFSSIAEVPQKEIVDALNTELLVSYSKEYATEIIDCVLKNREYSFNDFSSEKLRATLKEQLQEYIDRGEIDEQGIDDLYENIIESINDTLQYLPSLITNALSKASGIFAKLNFLYVWRYLLYIASISFFVLSLSIGSKKHIWYRLYGLVASAWITTVLLLVPFAVVHFQNLLPQLALSKTTIFYFIQGVYDTVILTPFNMLLILFAVLTVALILLCLYKAFRKVAHRTKPEHRQYSPVDFSSEDSSSSEHHHHHRNHHHSSDGKAFSDRYSDGSEHHHQHHHHHHHEDDNSEAVADEIITEENK